MAKKLNYPNETVKYLTPDLKWDSIKSEQLEGKQLPNGSVVTQTVRSLPYDLNNVGDPKDGISFKRTIRYNDGIIPNDTIYMHTNPEDIYREDPEIGFNKVFYKENEDKSKFKDLLNSELINIVNLANKNYEQDLVPNHNTYGPWGMAVARPRLQLIQQNLSTIKNNNLQQQKNKVDQINKANEEERIRVKNLNQFRLFQSENLNDFRGFQPGKMLKYANGGTTTNKTKSDAELINIAFNIATDLKKQGLISEVAGEQVFAQAFSEIKEAKLVFEQALEKQDVQTIVQLFTKLGIVK